ncbi:MAG: hypothetical protein FWD60_06200 [Candidatus Azobacteroides sp.]|nr:hypothetical protein [Candidatus Azobacteroides sp.]
MVVFIIIILIVGAILYFKFSADPAELTTRSKGRDEKQKKALRYFIVKDGCLQKTVKDEEYDALVKSILDSFNSKEKAMNKIGLDESELQEIDPVHFEGFAFGKKANYSKKGKDNKYRSSRYEITWLFFSSSQVYMHSFALNLDEDGKKESTEEYFYKDITNFSTVSDTEETPYWDDQQKKVILQNVDSNRFAITVPGDKFYCALEQNEYTERAIQAMKAKLREKKNT